MLKNILITSSLCSMIQTQAASFQRPVPIKTDFAQKCEKNGVLAKFLRTSSMSPEDLQGKLEEFGIDTTSPKIKLTSAAQTFLSKAKFAKKSKKNE